MNAGLRLLSLLAAGLVAGCAWPPPNPAALAAEDWGLLGDWRPECSGRPGLRSPSYDYVVRNEKLYQDRDFGVVKDELEVTSATLAPNGSLALTITFPQRYGFDPRKYVVERLADGRTRTTSDIDLVTGLYSVKDGKVLASGRPIGALTRCR